DNHVTNLLLSLQLLIIVTVGGVRTVWGPVVGAFLVVTLRQVSEKLFPSLSEQAGGQSEIVLYGIALILVLLLMPKGIAGGAGDLLKRWFPRSASEPATSEGSAR